MSRILIEKRVRDKLGVDRLTTWEGSSIDPEVGRCHLDTTTTTAAAAAGGRSSSSTTTTARLTVQSSTSKDVIYDFSHLCTYIHTYIHT